MARITSKLKGSTLIEVMVAMVIVIIIFGLAMMTFINIAKFSNNALKTEAYFNLQKVITETYVNKQFLDEDYEFENMVIRKSITPYPDCKDLRIILFSAYTAENKLIIEKKQVVKATD
jgi:type II secretory pathway pseudopilin PulG